MPPPPLPLTFDPEFDTDPAHHPIYPGYDKTKFPALVKRHRIGR
jgi:hypothetical protein